MIVIKDMEMPKGCQKCMYFRKHLFGNGLDYSYSCVLGATQFQMPWIRQIEEKASDCPLVEIVTCKNCKHHEDILAALYKDGTKKILHVCKKHGMGVLEDYFCGDGERKE